MNYLLFSDILWYLGHILSGSSVFFSNSNNYLAASLVVLAQGITIISRPIGRIKGNTYVNIEGNATENQSQDQNEIKKCIEIV